MRKNQKIKIGQKKVIYCKQCGKNSMTVDSNIKSFKCSLCCDLADPAVAEIFNKPKVQKGDKKTRNPRGWKFMKEFVDQNGNVYHRGILQPELKGTLLPSVIQKVPKKTKISSRQKYENQIEVFKKINDLKNQIITLYKQGNTKKAHKLEKVIKEYKKQNKKYIKK